MRLSSALLLTSSDSARSGKTCRHAFYSEKSSTVVPPSIGQGYFILNNTDGEGDTIAVKLGGSESDEVWRLADPAILLCQLDSSSDENSAISSLGAGELTLNSRIVFCRPNSFDA